MSPTFFLEMGLRSLARNPFFNPTGVALQEGESDFRLLDKREGLVVTLGPNASIFDRPGRSVCRAPGTKTNPRQCPHPLPKRSKIMREISIFLRILCGGGDVRLNQIVTLAEQRELLLTAGEGNVAEKIDLAELARDGAPPLLFLQPAYLCSSANVIIRSVACDPSMIGWARAPYVYKAGFPPEFGASAILCLSGRTMVWCERLSPGESRDFALGNVIASTTNIVSTLRPTSKSHPEDGRLEDAARPFEDDVAMQADDGAPQPLRDRVRDSFCAARILFESIRAREGFFLCEMTNRSDKPAYVFVQLNKNGFYGGSGLVGVVIRLVSAFFRYSHLSIGH
jgi:hypothetical protein